MKGSSSVLYTLEIQQSHIEITKNRWRANAHWYKQREESCFKELVRYIEQIIRAFESMEPQYTVAQLYPTARSLDDQLNRKINNVTYDFYQSNKN